MTSEEVTARVDRIAEQLRAARSVRASKGPYGPRRRIVEFGDVFDTPRNA